jgi:hypothetical protein
MIHRHLIGTSYTLPALDDLIENGTLADWRPVLARVRREPSGELANIAHLLSRRDYEEAGVFWRAFLADARRTRTRRRAAGKQKTLVRSASR